MTGCTVRVLKKINGIKRFAALLCYAASGVSFLRTINR